jgi:transcription antitermination factor NusG
MWYVVYTKPKNEDIVSFRLQKINLEVYNPKVKKKKISPLFPCYIFVKVPSHKFYRIIKYTRGVKRILGQDGVPYVLPSEMIELIKARERNGYVELKPKLNTGDRVVIKDGPFKNFIGVFEEELSARERVKILLSTVYNLHIVVEKSKIEKIL